MILAPGNDPSDETKQALARFLRMKADPIEFLKAVRTLDEVDKKNPIKPFPWQIEYIQWYAKIWAREPLIAVPKSRRMKMSWLNISLYLWDTLFNMGRHTAFVSKKEEDSDALVKRAQFIYDHLDPVLFSPELKPKMVAKFCNLEFPEIYSKIHGYPAGADQLRQHTMSGILGDECAFWPNAEEMFSGSKPTVEGGGRFTMISSPAPGFFKRLVYDKLDNNVGEDFSTVELDQGHHRSPIPGVTLWKNPGNKFFVFEAHFTADPAKRSEEFKAASQSGMPFRKWQQEYDLQWDSYTGLPVYSDWNREKHVLKHAIPIIGLPLLRGWDFGLTPACIVGQLQGNQLVILDEIIGVNIGADRFSDIALHHCSLKYAAWGYRKSDHQHWLDFIDPAGMNRDQSDEGSCARVLDSKGLNCIPGAVSFKDRVDAVESFLCSTTKGEMNFQVSVQCSKLIQGFEGGYQYSDNVLGREPSKVRPLKNEYSHPHDALQYLATGIRQFMRSHSKTKTKNVEYSWSKQRGF